MNTRAALRLVLVVLAVVAVAGAIVVAVLPLPSPAVGGTCGPGTSSEAAIAAFFDPVSIGAQREPAAGTEARYGWEAFVGECQASTNSRMVTSVALLTVALALVFAAFLIMNSADEERAATASTSSGLPPAGWYPDQSQPGRWRWWDGTAWGSSAPPSGEASTWVGTTRS